MFPLFDQVPFSSLFLSISGSGMFLFIKGKIML